MPDRARHIRRFLGQSDAVAALMDEIQRRDDLLQKIRRMLPSAVQPHCRQATIEAGRLTVSVDSPAWVDRLRFLSPQFIDALNRGDVEVTECRVRVLPELTAPVARNGSFPAASLPEAARCVEAAADCVGDAALAESLRRLARSLKQRD